ncbi:MAG: RNase J family beta-CASP ribonuclease [Alphaproteobacteria bacterium CG11_big_fil_rev_8_21_14_0_20_39_49]|nr:MAG: RNase J family beta-CASP ribonuclease [Alphaproteobacteria bacterium CG11_big_fil_rev_8_21_14_0_20_39_49]
MMTLNLKKHKNDLLFLPLGGSGEIGMNMNLYYLDGKWLIADFGAGFAEEYLPGVDMIVPDISFIQKYKDDIVGIVLTHAHEDHLGAIPYLWNELEVPVYATPFTAAFLKAKLNDNRGAKGVEIHEVEQGSSFKLGPFDLELVQITHSVPEMNAIFIRTKYGNIFHSGDWKLDPNPMLGDKSDIEKLKKIGKEGVLAMISDSTNVFSPGTSGSEGDLRESLTNLVGECKKMVMVTTFASNVARIESIAVAAKNNGRKVILAGRSLWRIVQAAKDSGYLHDAPEFLDTDQISKHPREKMLVISTGCQGEPMAATNKITSGTHRDIVLKPGDSVIFSSKIIPGNDKRIFRLFNSLTKLGVDVLTEKDHFVHVSGHPNVDDMKRMYDMINPQISIPVHGEGVHMKEHARLAKSWGIKQAIEVENGDVVKLCPEGAEKVTMVNAGELGIDGNFLLAPDCNIMKMRRKMQRDGIIIVTLILNQNNSFAINPIISAPGALDIKEDDDIFEDIMYEIEDALKQNGKGTKKQQSDDRIINVTRSAVRRVMKREVGKTPPIEVNIERI